MPNEQFVFLMYSSSWGLKYVMEVLYTLMASLQNDMITLHPSYIEGQWTTKSRLAHICTSSPYKYPHLLSNEAFDSTKATAHFRVTF